MLQCDFFQKLGWKKQSIHKLDVSSPKQHIQQITYDIGGYWNDIKNRRNFFTEFASQQGFDPLVAANWANVQNKEMIKQVKRGTRK